MATLTFLGATGTVTGSKYLLEAGGERLMVDCGLFQGQKELRLRNWNPLPVPPASIQWLLLTHAHLDHVGYIPRLVKDGFRGQNTGVSGHRGSRQNCLAGFRPSPGRRCGVRQQERLQQARPGPAALHL